MFARLLHEKEVSFLHTPMQLGEVVLKRTYASGGGLNRAANKDSEVTKMGLKSGFLEAHETQYEPTSACAVRGLAGNAVRVKAATLLRSLYHLFLRRVSRNSGWQAVDFSRAVLAQAIRR